LRPILKFGQKKPETLVFYSEKYTKFVREFSKLKIRKKVRDWKSTGFKSTMKFAWPSLWAENAKDL
jgi:hypothetical protein